MTMDERFDAVTRTLSGRSTRRQALRFTGAGLAGGVLAASGASALARKGKRSGRSGGGNGGRQDLEHLYLASDAITGSGDDGSTFTGSLYIKKFVAANGQLVALGKIVGTLTTADGKTKQVTRGLQVPVTDATMTGGDTGGGDVTAAATCGILNLSLGPLDLDLLGLVVHLDEINLTIDAESGNGNLLGNLLCSVADLLNGGGLAASILDQLAGLLNQILGAL